MTWCNYVSLWVKEKLVVVSPMSEDEVDYCEYHVREVELKQNFHGFCYCKVRLCTTVPHRV